MPSSSARRWWWTGGSAARPRPGALASNQTAAGDCRNAGMSRRGCLTRREAKTPRGAPEQVAARSIDLERRQGLTIFLIDAVTLPLFWFLVG